MALPTEFVAEMDEALDSIDAEEKGSEEASEETGTDKVVETKEEGAGEVKDSESEAKDSDGEVKDSEGEAKDSEGDESDGESDESEGEGDEEDGGDSKPVISDYALEQAVLAGIPVQDAKAFASEESLLRVAKVVQQRLLDADAAVNDATKDKPEGEDPLADLLKIDLSEFDPETAAIVGKLTSVIQSQQQSIDAFRTEQQEISQANLDAGAREVESWFDMQIKNLGEDFTDTLGEGDYSSLPQGSSQLAKRDAIADQMAVALAGYQAIGRTPPPRDEIFAKAAKLVLHDDYVQLREKGLAKKLAKRGKQHTQRAAGQKIKNNMSPEEEAAAAVDAKYGTP